MALRFLLVSLVAGMGLELPSGQDLSNWTRAGREWAGARMVEFSSLRGEAACASRGPTDCERESEGTGPAPTADAGPPTVDLAFDVVVEGMASAFAADLAAIGPDRPELDVLPEVIAEQSRGEDPPILAWTDPEPEPASFPAPAESRPDGSTGSPAMAGRVERLSAAVRLTRQALSAWALLIEGSAEILTDAR